MADYWGNYSLEDNLFSTEKVPTLLKNSIGNGYQVMVWKEAYKKSINKLTKGLSKLRARKALYSQ